MEEASKLVMDGATLGDREPTPLAAWTLSASKGEESLSVRWGRGGGVSSRSPAVEDVVNAVEVMVEVEAPSARRRGDRCITGVAKASLAKEDDEFDRIGVSGCGCCGCGDSGVV